MLCIFCKQISDSSKSQEHVIPESLGNKDHVLPPGWVCDACNNYLSREVEAPFMNSDYGRQARFDMRVESRRGRIPIGRGFHLPSRTKVDLKFDQDGLTFYASDGEDQDCFVRILHDRKNGSLWIPQAGDPEECYETSRFIAKVALEVLALHGVEIEGWNEEIAGKAELDEIRDYVRRGRRGFVWPVHMRRIYPAERRFSDDINPEFQVLHEFDLLFIPASDLSVGGEYYVVIAILGFEYAINLGGPELDSYLRWLDANDGRSYLYPMNNV